MLSLVMTQPNVSSTEFTHQQPSYKDDYSSPPANSPSFANNILIQNNYSTSSIPSFIPHQSTTLPETCTLSTNNHPIITTNNAPLHDGSSERLQVIASDADMGLSNAETKISSRPETEQVRSELPTQPQLSFCQMLQEHNYSTRMSMKMLTILDFANKLVVLVNSKDLPKLKEFIRKDIKNHGIALYGHIGGGPKLIREVINYVGSKRTKRKFLPLTTACILGCLRIVKFLMKNGANQYQKCMDELPVETAQRYGQKEIVRYLRDFSLDTCHKNRKIRKHFKHSLNDGLMSNYLHDITFTFTN